MRRRTVSNLVVVSAFALFCVLGLSFLAVGMGLEVPLARGGSRLSAAFAQTEGLVAQSDVRVSGVKVGRVVGMQPDGRGGTDVDMVIDPGVRLRQDVRAIVRPKSLIGEKYVELVRTPNSSAPYVREGWTIPRSQTSEAVEIDDVLNNMDPETRADFSKSLRELGVAVDGRSGDINQTIPGLEQTSAGLRPLAQTAQARQAQIDHILSDLAIIMAALADEQQALGQVVDKGDVAMGAIARRDQQLGGTVRQANTLFTSLDQTFADLTPADRQSLQESPPTIASGRNLLAQTNPAIDQLIPELLLAQVNYPNNQLNVSNAQAQTLALEWLSAFSQADAVSHQFRFTTINRQPSLPNGPAGLPGAPAGPGGPGAPGTPGAPGGGDPFQFLLSLPGGPAQ